MALNVQVLPGGGVRIVPGTEATRIARMRAAGIGRTGFRTRGRMDEGRPGHGLSFGGILRGVGKAVGAFVNPVGTLTEAVASFGDTSRRDFPSVTPCAPGFERDASGQCVRSGFIGTAQRFVPGGQTGTQRDVQGDAVVGAFGLPARIPAQVGTITKNDGGVSPILRCGPRMVLGFDNLCYPKAILGPRSKFRKHKRPVKPPVTAADMKAIHKASSSREKVAELAKDVGFTVKKSATRRKKR